MTLPVPKLDASTMERMKEETMQMFREEGEYIKGFFPVRPRAYCEYAKGYNVAVIKKAKDTLAAIGYFKR